MQTSVVQANTTSECSRTSNMRAVWANEIGVVGMSIPTNTSEEALLKLLDFLEGKSDYDGMWFGERLANKGSFWWRKDLRKLIKAYGNEVEQEAYKKGHADGVVEYAKAHNETLKNMQKEGL